jgi:hypothetical protein
MGCRQAAITRAIPHTRGPALVLRQAGGGGGGLRPAGARERREPLTGAPLAETHPFSTVLELLRVQTHNPIS